MHQNIAIIALLCGLTSLIAHMALAVFHDGIRPILPEVIAGRFGRKEAGDRGINLSLGFILSVGIFFSLGTGMMNPWILFLSTDIIGVMSPKKWIAFLLGSIWGGFIYTLLNGGHELLSATIENFDQMAEGVGSFVMLSLLLTPILAIIYQYGWKKGVGAGLILFMVRIGTIKFTDLSPDVFQLLAGMIILFSFSIFKDLKTPMTKEEVDEDYDMFKFNIDRVEKNWFLIAIAGGMIALVSNMRLFAGSEISTFTLAGAYKLETGRNLIEQVAVAEIIRGIAFLPLVVTSALTTGVYSIVGCTFVFAAGYLAPNPITAVVLGMSIILIEIKSLKYMVKAVTRFPTLKDSCDYIRNALNNIMELSLLIGGVFGAYKIGGPLGFFTVFCIYFVNEATGRPVLKIAIPIIGVVLTSLILLVTSTLGINI